MENKSTEVYKTKYRPNFCFLEFMAKNLVAFQSIYILAPTQIKETSRAVYKRIVTLNSGC